MCVDVIILSDRLLGGSSFCSVVVRKTVTFKPHLIPLSTASVELEEVHDK